MTPREPTDVEQLAAQTLWVRRLALAVARDAHAADDLAQDAWLAALRRRPSADDGLGAWFAAVIRNLVRFRVRSEVRRASREHAAARPELEDDPALALERLETQEQLLRAVRQLAEPYRSTVILRWFEGLEPAEIARRTGAPVRTVHTRLARALVQLREHLGRRDQGGRATWTSAWLPLLPKTAGPLSWIVVVQLKTKLGLAAAAAVALASAWLLFDSRAATPLAAPAAVASSDATLASPEVSSRTLAPTIDERAQVDAPPKSAHPEPALSVAVETPPPADIEGLVVDVSGAPVRDLEVLFHGRHVLHSASPRDQVTAVTDAFGRFRMPPRTATGGIAPNSDAWVAVLEPLVRGSGGSHVLVVAPRIDHSGRVVDPLGQPIAGAELSVILPDLRSRLELVLDASVLHEWSVTSREHGVFLLAKAPAVEGAVLRTRAMGYEDDTRALPLVSNSELEFVLRPIRDATRRLTGRVVDAEGAAVSEAWVALGDSAVRSDEAGRFEIDLERAELGSVLRAVHAGYLPAELACAASSPRDPTAWPDPLVLVLDQACLSIAGRVLDAGRAPVAGVRLEVLETTPFADIEATFGSMSVRSREDLEPLIAGRAFRYYFETDEAGRFEVRGLLPHAYRLLVFDHRSLAVLETEPIEAGAADVELVLPASERRARVAGRVVDRSGAPVEGASVRPLLAQERSARSRYHALSGDAVRTDASGAFEFLGLSVEADRLEVSAPRSPDLTEVALASAEDLEALVIAVPLHCHLQVDLSESKLDADSIAVLDAQGEHLTLAAYQGDGSYSANRVGLQDRRSQALAVSDDARTLVLYRGETEVARHPIRLLAGELNVVRP